VKEIWTMWKNTRMIVLTALSAALYAGLTIPFKAIPIIPGITELRLSAPIPIVLGILFGPAAAWGSAIGNLIGDFFGTMGPGSIFGFIGMFLTPLISYKLWGAWLVAGKRRPALFKTAMDVLYFELIAIVAGCVTGTTIAWGLELLHLMPFAALSTIISLNNILSTLVVGPILFALIAPRLNAWGLVWTKIMDPKDVSDPKLPAVGVPLGVAGAVGGLVIGVLISVGTGSALLGGGIGKGVIGGLGILLGVLPFIIAYIVSAIIL
jgi:energy-coupling factor transport system substrate-specific component